MPASLRARLDLAQLSEQLSCLHRTRSTDDLAETLLEMLTRTLGRDQLLLVLLDAEGSAPTVYGGSFQERREIQAALRGGALSEGVVDLAAALGKGMRVVPIRDRRETRGLVLVGGGEPGIDAEDLEYVRFLADRTAEVLPRHSLQAMTGGPRLRSSVGKSSGAEEVESGVGPTSPAAVEKVPARILCVDEDATVLSLLRAVFERDGHEVTCVRGSQLGIETFLDADARGQGYDLVVCELSSRGTDSFEAIRQIRTTSPESKVLLLAPERGVLPPDLNSDRGLKTLSKPIDPIAIRISIREMLSQS